ncbi:hypothetical protein [Maricaulis sp.]|uniref:hypothetical protein n=1 Tax=Maricaulis sp. TaxID=1486257 RepID=UPI003A955F11
MRFWIFLAVVWMTFGATGFAQNRSIQSALPDNLDVEALRIGPSMATLSAPQLGAEIRRSPLFIAELDSVALLAGGPVAIELGPGVELDLQQYIAASRLTNLPVLAVATAEPTLLNLAGPVSVTEEIFVMTDRIIVSREAVIPVSAETCGYSPRRARPNGRPGMAGAIRAELDVVTAARAGLCLLPGERSLEDLAASAGGQPVLIDPSERLTPRLERRSRIIAPNTRLMLPPSQADIRAEADDIRAELAGQSPNAQFRRGFTIAEALALGDEDLIGLDANGDERVITRVSIIPLADRTTTSNPDVRPIDGSALTRGFELDQPIGRQIGDLPAALAPYVTRRGSLRSTPDFQPRLPGNLMQRPDAPLARLERGGRAQQVLPGVNESGRSLTANLPNNRVIQRLPGAEPSTPPEARLQRISQSSDYYFITGFTLTDQIEERFKHTFNRRKNYYVAFEYHIGYRAGLRFPFRVAVESEAFFREDPQTRVWNASNFQFNVNAEARQDTRTGGSIYRAAGMPESMIFDDREFTFGVWAGCQLQMRVPVIKTVRINCPSVSVPRAGTCPNWACADFVPPVGVRQRIAAPRLPADVTGLQINAWIARAGIEPGVNIYAADGQVSLRAHAEDGRFTLPGEDPSYISTCTSVLRSDMRVSNELLNSGDCRLVFDRPYTADRPMSLRLDLGERGSSRFPGVILSDPEYRFTMEFVPVLELFAVIDLAFTSWRFDHDIEISGLTIRQDMRFGHHAETRETGDIGLCGPSDTTSPGCSRAAGYTFRPIQIDNGGPG